MVEIKATSGSFVAIVTTERFDGERSEIARYPKTSQDFPVPSDVFDYANEALGYFRFHIDEMPDVASIEIEVQSYGECIELKSITRD